MPSAEAVEAAGTGNDPSVLIETEAEAGIETEAEAGEGDWFEQYHLDRLEVMPTYAAVSPGPCSTG